MLKLGSVAIIAILAAGLAQAAGWPPADDYLNSINDCQAASDKAGCEYAKATWSKNYQKAVKGEYQGQRNVSFCLSTGCNEAIRINPVLGCAWRIVIIQSGHLETDITDTSNQKHFCGPELLDDAGRQAAAAQSKQLLKLLGR
ncbi:hypothetical protein [Rhizobium sp. S163]|uniref:hypothetical protein n=1 Tax=Rhizobium sp. S163 TaxID=3055039 RepID=UPI0025AA2BCE|nr:hypothetical protein [Rhizobium sp. S163]MDM9647743.1 hypothetical protein [Rhizobium sp. S163]